MPRSDLKKAIHIIAGGFGVSYQHAQTRIWKAITQGTINTIAVVRDRVDLDTWLAIGFKMVWQMSSRAAESGIGGIELSAPPGTSLIAMRDSKNPNDPPMWLSREALKQVTEGLGDITGRSALEAFGLDPAWPIEEVLGPSPALPMEAWPATDNSESRSIARAEQDDSPTG